MNEDLGSRNSNPAVAITIQFEQGNALAWRLKQPWSQGMLFMELGFLAARYNLGIEFDFPTHRETLEADYDRPSFHCADWTDRVIGAISAIMEQHQDLCHHDLVAGGNSFSWYDNHCDLCGFDARAAFQEAFPELVEERPAPEGESLD